MSPTSSTCSPRPPPNGGSRGGVWPSPTYTLWASRQAQRRAYGRGYRHGVAVALACVALTALTYWALCRGLDREFQRQDWEAAHRAATMASGRPL